MQADPAGVLPGATEAGEGQLQGAGGRMEAQPLGAEVLQQQPADAKPERVTARQQNPRPAGRECVRNPLRPASIPPLIFFVPFRKKSLPSQFMRDGTKIKGRRE